MAWCDFLGFAFSLSAVDDISVGVGVGVGDVVSVVVVHSGIVFVSELDCLLMAENGERDGAWRPK